MKILIISSNTSIDKDSNDFSKSIDNAAGEFEVTVCSAEKLHYEIRESIDKSRIMIDASTDISEFDVVYIKRAVPTYHHAQSCALYLSKKNKKFITSDILVNNNVSADKLFEHILFSAHSFPLPETYLMSPDNFENAKSNLIESVNFPMVLKSTKGSRGRDNYLVEGFDEILDILKSNPREYLLQPYIPNSFDYRILVFGYKTRLVIKRTRTSEDTHLNNTSMGATPELVALPDVEDGIIELSERAAKLLQREICGVDIMINSADGSLILLELNRPPEIETGSYVAEKCRALADYFNEIGESLK